MANELIVKANANNIINKDLRKATETIAKLAISTNSNYLGVAYEIAKISRSESYKDEYKNISDWTSDYFGIKKSTAYNLIAIGTHFITETDKGAAKKYHSILTGADERDFSISQLYLFLPYDPDDIEVWCNDGELKPTMSVKEIKAKLKALSGDEETESEEAESEELAEEAESEEISDMIAVPRMTVAEIINELAKVKNKKSGELIMALNKLLA